MENNTKNTNIQKPISLIIEEAKSTVANAINSVQLHPTILEMIMKELYLEVQDQANVMTQREKHEYERLLIESINVENEVSDEEAE